MLNYSSSTDYELISNYTIHSSSSSCSYQLQSLSSNTGDYNTFNNRLLDDVNAYSTWILELRWHTESECCNILQSKVIPESYISAQISRKSYIPISLSVDILEEKFRLIAENFQSIFRISQPSKPQFLSPSTTERLSEIISITQEMLLLMRYDLLRKTEEDRTILSELIRLKIQVEKNISDLLDHAGIKTVITDIIEYGRTLASLKQMLIISLTEKLVSYLRLCIKQNSFRNSSYAGNELKHKNQAAILKKQTQKINAFLNGAMNMVQRSNIYCKIFMQCQGILTLIRMCCIGQFSRCWPLALKVLTYLSKDKETVAELEKNNFVEVICGILSNISSSESIQLEAVRLLAQITLVKISSITTCSMLSSDALDRLQSNMDNLVNALTMLCAVTISGPTFVMATTAINNLLFLFPEEFIGAMRPNSIHILVSVCLSENGQSFVAKDNVAMILANLSFYPQCEKILVENNAIELVLQFLVELLEERLSFRRLSVSHTLNESRSELLRRKVTFIMSLLQLISNVCCKEANIDLLTENNEVQHIFLVREHIVHLRNDFPRQAEKCLLLIDLITGFLESKLSPCHSKNIQAFLKQNDARESDV